MSKGNPKYCFHVSGRAFVTVGGKRIYLGTHGTPEGYAKYSKILQTLKENDGRFPDGFDINLNDAGLSVSLVTAEFRSYAESRYSDNENERRRLMLLCDLLDEKFGDVAASKFWPRKLNELRNTFIDRSNARRYVNDQVARTVQIFKHAVSMELIKISQLDKLRTLEPLLRGKTAAKESKRRTPASLESVRAALGFMSPTSRAIRRVMVSTGMRLFEVTSMKPANVNRSGEVWVYVPDKHKTENYGYNKVVPILGDARDALAPFLLRGEDKFCSSPKESAEWHRARKRQSRKTKPRDSEWVKVRHPKRKPGDKFSKDSLRQSLHRACDKAGAERFSLYQLRHPAATEIANTLDLESAQTLLGHSSRTMTEHYAQKSLIKATEAAMAAPVVG